MAALSSSNEAKLAQNKFCFLKLNQNQTGTNCDDLSGNFGVKYMQRKPYKSCHNYLKLGKYFTNKFSLAKSNSIFQTLMTGHLFAMLMNVNTQI